MVSLQGRAGVHAQPLHMTWGAPTVPAEDGVRERLSRSVWFSRSRPSTIACSAPSRLGSLPAAAGEEPGTSFLGLTMGSCPAASPGRQVVPCMLSKSSCAARCTTDASAALVVTASTAAQLCSAHGPVQGTPVRSSSHLKVTLGLLALRALVRQVKRQPGGLHLSIARAIHREGAACTVFLQTLCMPLTRTQIGTTYTAMVSRPSSIAHEPHHRPQTSVVQQPCKDAGG